jgi:transcriptional regulator
MIEKTPYDDYFMTQQEVADALGMSRGNVGAIEIKAKKKLKRELEKRGFKVEDFIGAMI